MKATKISCLVECEDGKIRQVLLTEEQTEYLFNFLNKIHDGAIRVLDDPLDGVEITTVNYEPTHVIATEGIQAPVGWVEGQVEKPEQ